LVLLACDEGEHQTERSTNEEIARVLHISMRKVERVKKRFVEEGFHAALIELQRAARGFALWSLRSISRHKVVETQLH